MLCLDDQFQIIETATRVRYVKRTQNWSLSKRGVRIEMDLFQSLLSRTRGGANAWSRPQIKNSKYRRWSPRQLWFSSVQWWVVGLQCGAKMVFLFYDENSKCSGKKESSSQSNDGGLIMPLLLLTSHSRVSDSRKCRPKIICQLPLQFICIISTYSYY